MGYSFLPASILLPKDDVDMSKWSVVACDQYTSNKRYWNQVNKLVDGVPSTYNIIYPEVYLNDGSDRTASINKTMATYLEDVLEEKVHHGFVLVERDTESGKRLGLIGVIDLENYDYSIDSQSPIRATEGTIESRIPPRKAIRQNAPLEVPHIMVLVDDINKTLIEPLYDHKDSFYRLYDFDLMKNGGHIAGYAIDGDYALTLSQKINEFEDQSTGIFLAMGDGNHSLATAKACWEEIKGALNEEAYQNHPARYALVELVNLHSDALKFEPIHRVVFNVDKDDIYQAFNNYIESNNMMILPGDEITIVGATDDKLEIDNKQRKLAVDVLQSFLDQYLEEHPEASIDYIHGEEETRELAKENGVGFLLNSISKENLFQAIMASGALPRKTFSMGNANEKRYYLECRKLVK